MSTAIAPAPASAGEAMAMVHAGLAFLAGADATAMSAAERARCLKELEQADAVATAARTVVLGAFAAGQDYADDGDYSACSWLIHRTRVTKGAAADHTGWVKRGAGHPLVLAALAARGVPVSFAREICSWTGKLPEGSRQAADEILLGAAASGLGLADLAGLAGEMYERSRQGTPDGEGPDGEEGDDGSSGAGPDDRAVRVSTTLGGAGVIRGALTPQCAEFVTTVLDALSAPAGAGDDRTHEQRYHDALQEAMRRLMAAGLVPERGGAAVQVLAYVSLADLMLMEGSSALLAEWTAGLRARWAGHRAAAAAGGGHQGLWLDGDAAQGIACDAAIAPVVVGDVDPGAFDDLVRLCVQLDKLRQHGVQADAEPGPGPDGPGAGPGADPGPGISSGSDGDGPEIPAAFGGGLSRQALEQAIIGQAAGLLSGPGGLASFLRRRQLGATRLGGPSLPLDIGYAKTVPAGIRKAARLRGRHCEWAGGCGQPAGTCEVHHTTHQANGGTTSLKGCVLLCFYHHHVMIHRLGWTLVVNPDGTTTAWNKDKTRVLHSHGPPARAG